MKKILSLEGSHISRNMATKIFSPFITRLRKRVQNERLLESDESFLLREEDFLEVHDDGPTENVTTELTIEANQFDSGNASTRNNLAIELCDSSNFARNGNVVTLSTKIKAPAKKKFAFLGIILAIIAALIFSVSALMVKLAESIPSLEVTFMRLTIQAVFSLPAMIFFQDKFIYPWKQSRFLLLRGISGTTAMTLMIYAVKHMPLADARVIFYTSPVFTAILGRIFLKESVSRFDVVAMILSIGGVVLIGKPTFLFGSLGENSGSKQVWVPTLFAVAAAIGAATSTVLTRKMSQELGPRVVVFYFAVVGSIIGFVGSVISGFRFPVCGTHDSIYMLAVGGLGYFGQVVRSKSLTMEKASVISLVGTIGIGFSFSLQLLVLDVVPNVLSIAGAILVLLCNVIIFIKKFHDMKKIDPKGLEQ